MSDTHTIPVGSETAADLDASVDSACCPMCGGDKRRFHTLCGPCFDRMPPAFRGPLVAERPNALRRALLGLGAYSIHLPTPALDPRAVGGGRHRDH